MMIFHKLTQWEWQTSDNQNPDEVATTQK